MADLYILAADLPPHDDPKIQEFQYKAGDVIAVREDGDGAGTSVVGNPMYKVFRVPGPASDWEYLLASRPFDPDAPAPKRIKTLDIVSVYAMVASGTMTDPKLGEVKAVDADRLKLIEHVTEAKSGDLVIG